MGRMVRAYVKYGFDNFLIVTGHGAAAVEEEMENLNKELTFTYSTVFNSKDEEMNNCYSLLIAINGLDEDVLVSNKDIVFEPLLLEKVQSFRDVNFLVIDNVQPLDEEDMKIYADGDRVKDISKSLETGKGYGEYIGISVIRKSSLASLRASLEKIVKESSNLYYEDAYRLMLESEPFYVLNTDDAKWGEIDTPEDVLKAKEVVDVAI